MVFSNNLLMGAASTTAAPAAGYVPKGAVWLDGTADYLTRTNSGSATSDKTFTVSYWFKNANPDFSSNVNYYHWGGTSGGSGLSGEYLAGGIGAGAAAGVPEYTITYNGSTLYSDAKFRDPTAWQHFVCIIDSANDTSSSRNLVYHNGKLITWESGTDITQDKQFKYMQDTYKQFWGVWGYFNGTESYTPGYFSECALVDGLALGPENFGTEDSNGVWIPKDLTGLTWGNYGFWLDFEDTTSTTTIGYDVSGNSNHFTTSSFASGTSNWTYDRPADSSTDTGNYCTFNSNYREGNGYNLPLSLGNLTFTNTSFGRATSAIGTFPMSSGKWYWEISWSSAASGLYSRVGIGQVNDIAVTTPDGGTAEYLGRTAGSWSFAAWATGTEIGQKETDATWSDYYNSAVTVSDKVGVAFDADNGAIWISINGSWVDGSRTGQSSATVLASIETYANTYVMFDGLTDGPYVPIVTFDGSVGVGAGNFGQTAYSYTPPTGFNKLNTSNLTAPAVTKPSDNVLPILYEGNGTGQRVGNFIPFTDSKTVNYSARFDGAADYLSFDPTASVTGQKTFTISAWIKKNDSADYQSIMSATDNATSTSQFGFGTSGGGGTDNLLWFYTGGSNVELRTSTQVSNTGSWNHVLLVVDTTESTNTNRVKIYLNGVQQTLTPTNSNGDSGYPTLNEATKFCVSSTFPHVIGSYYGTGAFLNAYVSEFVFIDSTAYGPSSFGQTDTSTNRWIPKDVSGLDFGTNGCYLDMADGNDLGDDESGEGNDFIESGFDTTNSSNQMYDTPTRNFDTFNSSSPMTTTGNLTMGNLKMSGRCDNTGNNIIPADGKFYWEVLLESASGVAKDAIGIMTVAESNTGSYGTSTFLYAKTGDTWTGTAWSSSLGWATYTTGDVIGVYYNAGSITFYKNGSSQGTVTPGWATNPIILTVQGNASNNFVLNTGSWRYFDGAATTLDTDAGGYFQQTSLPTDSKALQQDNYDSNTAGITGLSWIKNRDATDFHIWFDRAREIYNYLRSSNASGNTTDGYANQATNTNSVQQFLQQGVQVGNMNEVNTSAESYVLWNWANDGAATTNSDGTVTSDSTVRVNTDAGFSIVTYTGQNSAMTVGHGLGAKPDFIVLKGYTRPSGGTAGWYVYHSSLGATNAIWLDLSSGVYEWEYWNDVEPTADVFSVGWGTGNTGMNASGDSYLAYCWAEVEGYSRFGIYEGNTDPNGPVINLGFRPSILIWKNIDDATAAWRILDSARNPYNPINHRLYPNQDWTEANNDSIDFTANGFKVITNSADVNTNTIIYAAWAENPFGGSGVGQAKAY